LLRLNLCVSKFFFARLHTDSLAITSATIFSPWRRGGSSTQAWMPTYVSILRILQMIWVWTATVEWYWQGKIEELGEKPVPVPLCPPQIPHGSTRARTRVYAARGRRLTTWAMAHGPLQPLISYLFGGIEVELINYRSQQLYKLKGFHEKRHILIQNKNVNFSLIQILEKFSWFPKSLNLDLRRFS
jgi:hypothetical protein